MATSVSRDLIEVITEGQARMLEYLKRADERGERQSRATLKALTTLQEGQKAMQEDLKIAREGLKEMQKGQQSIARMLIDMQAITVRALELTRDIHSEVLDKKSSRH